MVTDPLKCFGASKRIKKLLRQQTEVSAKTIRYFPQMNKIREDFAFFIQTKWKRVMQMTFNSSFFDVIKFNPHFFVFVLFFSMSVYLFKFFLYTYIASHDNKTRICCNKSVGVKNPNPFKLSASPPQ